MRFRSPLASLFPFPFLFLLAVLASGLGSTASAATTEAPTAKTLVERSKAAMRVDPQLSRTLAEAALAQLERAPDPDLQVMAHWLLCDYQAERDPAAAAEQLALGRALLPKVRNAGAAAYLLGCEGDSHELAGRNQQALALYEQAVAVAEQTHDDEALGNALYQRGYLRGVRGEFANGLSDLRRANQTYERLGLPQQAMSSLNAVATLYDRMGDHEQARHYFEIALKAQQASGQRREEIVTQHNLGRALENLGDWDAAQGAFTRVLAMSRELDYPRAEAYALRGLARVANARDKPETALQLLDRASAVSGAAPDERLRGQILLQRGIALGKLHRAADSAATLEAALRIFDAADSKAELAATGQALAAAAAELGDYRSAYEHLSRFKAVSDQLLHRQLDDRFATLKVEFDSATKDKENLLLQHEKAATERALAQEKQASTLRAVALGLAALLVAALGLLVRHHRRASHRLQGLAMTDELTLLPNRRHLLASLDALVSEGGPCAVLIVDIDLFKAINDELGHLVGDEVLRHVADALRSEVPEGASLGRIGGEEFIVVMPSVGLDEAVAVADRLRLAVAALDGKRWSLQRPITISLGVTVRQPDDVMGAMLRRADDALYDAKRSGRNCVRVNAPAAAAASAVAHAAAPAGRRDVNRAEQA